MIQFKGFDDWVPIFRGGRQVDSAGVEHDGDALIDKALSTFNAARHEPPATIGHPADNRPAYGWVRGLKEGADQTGRLLLAKFGQVEPTFAAMVKSGRFKKRSAAFYPDGSLRHVAFLGAAPPAVKGLPDLAFNAPAAASFEFSDMQTVWGWQAVADLFGRIRDYLIEKEGVEKADAVIANYQITEIQDAAAKIKEESITKETIYREKEEKGMNFNEFMQKLKDLVGAVDEAGPPTANQFSEADVKQAAADAARREREKLTAEFAEKERLARQDARREEIASFCESMVKAGKMTPAMIKFGVPEFMAAFAEKDEPIEFASGTELNSVPIKATLYDRFKLFFEQELPKMVEFKEIASRDKDVGGKGNAGERLGALTREKMAKDQNMTYGAAFSEAQRENPELAREYLAEIQEV